MKASDLVSDKAMERTFFTSAALGIGCIFAPWLAPIAITGMVGSQSIFWGKRIAGQTDDKTMS